MTAILMRTALTVTNREDIWASEVRFKALTPARRDKLVALLNLAGFTFKGGVPVDGEIIDNGGVYKIGAV